MLERLSNQRPPDVLVLDWVMPGVSGIDVCRFLRSAHRPQSPLAILLLTVQTQTQQIVEGLEAGANDYLLKPFADPELRARVAALLRSNALLERAQSAEARVRELLEHAPDPLIGVGQEHRITFVNAEAQRILGQNAEALTSKTLAEVLPTMPVDEVGPAARISLPLSDIEIGGEVLPEVFGHCPSKADDVAHHRPAQRDGPPEERVHAGWTSYLMIAHDPAITAVKALLMRTGLSCCGGRRGVLSAGDDRRPAENGNQHARLLVALIKRFSGLCPDGRGGHIGWIGLRFDLRRSDRRDRRRLSPCGGQQPTANSASSKDRLSRSFHGDCRRLQQVSLTNLLANAVKFTPAVGGASQSSVRRLTGPPVRWGPDRRQRDPASSPILSRRAISALRPRSQICTARRKERASVS